jgi:hypothetical protein
MAHWNSQVFLVGVAGVSARRITFCGLSDTVRAFKLDTSPGALVEAVLETVRAACGPSNGSCGGGGESRNGDHGFPHDVQESVAVWLRFGKWCCLRGKDAFSLGSFVDLYIMGSKLGDRNSSSPI